MRKLKRYFNKYLLKKFDSLFFQNEEIKRQKRIDQIAKVGTNFTIQDPFYFAGPEKIFIGSNVSFAAFVHIWGHGEVYIGDNCLIASHTAITSVTHNPQRELFNTENVLKKVVIGNNVWIGSHAVIFPGVTIGDNVIIAAGCIVNKDIESNSVYGGVPGKLLYKLNSQEKIQTITESQVS